MWHTFDQEQVEQLVAEHRTMVDEFMPEVHMVIDDLYGKKSPRPDDPHHREGGRLANGGIKLSLPVYINALIGGIFLLLATIAGALITKL